VSVLSSLLNTVHFEHLVAVVIDDLDGNLSRRGRLEGVTLGAVEGGPLGLVDLGAEGALELAVGVVGAEEVGVADEEALAVVVSVDEPAGDVVGRGTADLAGRRVVDIDALHFDNELAIGVVGDGDVGLAEDHEQVAGPGVLESVADQEVGVHPSRKNRELAIALGFLRDVRVEGEAGGKRSGCRSRCRRRPPWQLP
jgi:hypothetical protein